MQFYLKTHEKINYRTMNSTCSDDLLLVHPAGPKNSWNKEGFEINRILNCFTICS